MRLIDTIEKAIADVLKGHSNVIAALAMGSCARGEETYYVNGVGERKLLSDYEMLIIVKDGSNTSDVDAALKILSEALKNKSNMDGFELEWSFKTKREIKRLDKRFIFFEAKESGRVIFGDQSILEIFPSICIDNLNFCELDTIIIHRLYHVLRDYAIPDRHYQQYLIARNTLDIATAALPHMGILVCGYKERNSTFINQADRKYFSESLMGRLQDYLQMKLSYDDSMYEKYSLEDMKHYYIKDMQDLYSYQKHVQHGKAFIRNSRMLFSAVYRMNLNLLLQWFSWPKTMEKLYTDMIHLLKEDTVDEQLLSNVSGTMMRIFGY